MISNGYINVADRAIYASLALPEKQEAAGVVLLCEPFGEEKRCAYRMLVRLSKALVARGYACLRYDVSGTGDSSGNHAEARWSQWNEETAAALDFARKASGASEGIVMGFRAGALLAAALPCKQLVLVEPVLSGRELLEDLERRQKIKGALTGPVAGSGTAEDSDGLKDFGGFGVSSQMAKELSQVELTALCQAQSPATSIHLCRVTGAKALPPAWQALGALADASPNGSTAILRDKPFWGQVDYFESDVVIDHLLQLVSGKDAGALGSRV